MDRKKPFSVWEINRYIKGKLQVDPHLRHLWVGGELSNFKKHRSGHMFFTLKDAHASLRCVFFKGYNRFLSFLPSDGMEVWITGHISIYEKEGLYQLYVEQMEPAGTGSLYTAFEQLKERLQQEGLFQEQHKKSLPRVPRRMALITSPTGAALQDMLTTAARRFPYVELVVVESLVQGSRAPEDLVKALQYTEENLEVDLAVLARGGGSLEELWAFNSEETVRAIFNCTIPVVSAVGHETDFTIADFTADLRASTPTAAMELVLPDITELNQHFSSLLRRSRDALTGKLYQEKQRLAYVLGRRFQELPYGKLEREHKRLKDLHTRLAGAVTQRLTDKARSLHTFTEKLETLSPLHIMQRGYTYSENQEGQPITSVHQVSEGQILYHRFYDGRIKTRVEKKEPNEPTGAEGDLHGS